MKERDTTMTALFEPSLTSTQGLIKVGLTERARAPHMRIKTQMWT